MSESGPPRPAPDHPPPSAFVTRSATPLSPISAFTLRKLAQQSVSSSTLRTSLMLPLSSFFATSAEGLITAKAFGHQRHRLKDCGRSHQLTACIALPTECFAAPAPHSGYVGLSSAGCTLSLRYRLRMVPPHPMPAGRGGPGGCMAASTGVISGVFISGMIKTNNKVSYMLKISFLKLVS